MSVTKPAGCKVHLVILFSNVKKNIYLVESFTNLSKCMGRYMNEGIVYKWYDLFNGKDRCAK
jgi:hypothetical protein